MTSLLYMYLCLAGIVNFFEIHEAALRDMSTYIHQKFQESIAHRKGRFHNDDIQLQTYLSNCTVACGRSVVSLLMFGWLLILNRVFESAISVSISSKFSSNRLGPIIFKLFIFPCKDKHNHVLVMAVRPTLDLLVYQSQQCLWQS